jgi:hypothetical protein
MYIFLDIESVILYLEDVKETLQIGSPMSSSTTAPTSARAASLVAGVALALLAVVAGVANFAVLGALVVPGDAEATVGAIVAGGPLFRVGIALLVTAVILDVVIAAALNRLLAEVNETVSATAAWLRVAYAAVFLVAISQLMIAAATLDDPDAALRAIDAFTTIWDASLILFAVHLLLVGALAFRSGFVPRVFGILLVIAGLGYLIDGFLEVLVAEPTVSIAQFVFIGEVALIFWLLIAGGRRRAVAA